MQLPHLSGMPFPKLSKVPLLRKRFRPKKMAAQKTKTLGTGKWLKFPSRQSSSETPTGVYDESRRLGQVDWDDRIVLFNGKWFCSPVTVKPRFEAWDYAKLQATEPDLVVDSDAATFMPKTRNVILFGLGVLGVLGAIYFLRWKHRKSFESKVANAAAASVQQAFDRALQNSAEGAIAALNSAAATVSASARDAIASVRTSVGSGCIGPECASPTQDNLDLQGALVQALKDTGVKEAIGLAVRDAIASVQTSTGEATEGHLDASDEQERNLGTFLDKLSVVVSEPTL